MTRRTCLSAAAAAFAASAAPGADNPWRSEFPVTADEVCLNNAHWHPMSAGAMRAVQKYLDFKAHGFSKYAEYGMELQKKVREEFAALIGARTSEIAFVPSTMAGENIVVNGLDFPPGSNVVTDALHFEASLYLYRELARTRGVELRIVEPRDGGQRILLRDLAQRIDRKTRLVSLSLVSMINGFQHDLKAVCDLAHSVNGALVYADIIQAAGAVPIDVRASGVDFTSCASYKWLMGDMGVGFLYVREDLQHRVLRRTQYGYRQLGPSASGAAALVEVGTISNTTIAALSHSLPFLRSIGVATIEDRRQPLLARIQAELPRLGFEPLTPRDSRSPVVSFARRNARQQLLPRLQSAGVNIEVYDHRIRISPSIYNTLADVERLLEALS